MEYQNEPEIQGSRGKNGSKKRPTKTAVQYMMKKSYRNFFLDVEQFAARHAETTTSALTHIIKKVEFSSLFENLSKKKQLKNCRIATKV